MAKPVPKPVPEPAVVPRPESREDRQAPVKERRRAADVLGVEGNSGKQGSVGKKGILAEIGRAGRDSGRERKGGPGGPVSDEEGEGEVDFAKEKWRVAQERAIQEAAQEVKDRMLSIIHTLSRPSNDPPPYLLRSDPLKPSSGCLTILFTDCRLPGPMYTMLCSSDSRRFYIYWPSSPN